MKLEDFTPPLLYDESTRSIDSLYVNNPILVHRGGSISLTPYRGLLTFSATGRYSYDIWKARVTQAIQLHEYIWDTPAILEKLINRQDADDLIPAELLPNGFHRLISLGFFVRPEHVIKYHINGNYFHVNAVSERGDMWWGEMEEMDISMKDAYIHLDPRHEPQIRRFSNRFDVGMNSFWLGHGKLAGIRRATDGSCFELKVIP